MGWARCAVTNENWAPLQNIDVEAFDLDSPTKPVDTATTDNAGMALFLLLPDDKRYFFKPRITRSAGSYGDQQQYGKVNVQLLAHSAMMCIDAYVEPSGQWGTDKTIQAAIDRLAGITGNVSIFIQDGTYTEQLSITSSTAFFTITGCSPYLVDWPADGSTTLPTSPLGTIVDGTSGKALTYNATKPLAIHGIHFKNSSATNTTVLSSNASGRLRLIDCVVVNANNSGVCLGAVVDQILIEHCIIASGNGTFVAINLSTNTTCHIQHCWIIGATAAVGGTGVFISESSMYASMAATNFVVAPGASKGRLVNNYIKQAGAGEGVGLIAVANPSVGWEVVGNQIDGAGSGTSAHAVWWTDHGQGTVAGNTIQGWAIGIEITGDAQVELRGNHYKDVTTYVSVTKPPWFIGARARNETTQSIPNAVATKVVLSTEDFDPGSWFDSTTNYRFTAPASGYYQVNGRLLYDIDGGAAPPATQMSAMIYKNGSKYCLLAEQPGSLTGYVTPGGSDILLLVAGDYIELWAYQDSGGAINLIAGQGANVLSISLLQQ